VRGRKATARRKPPCRFKPAIRAFCAGRYSEPKAVRSLSDTFNIHRTLPIDNNSAR
jgi:hypothetical protein